MICLECPVIFARVSVYRRSKISPIAEIGQVKSFGIPNNMHHICGLSSAQGWGVRPFIFLARCRRASREN
jgi:hypothetical protein